MVHASSIRQVLDRFEGTRVFLHSVKTVARSAGLAISEEESHRALLLARHGDIVVVPSGVDEEVARYYASLGFEVVPDRIVVVSGSEDLSLPERLRANPGALDQLVSLLGNGPVALDTFGITDDDFQAHFWLQQNLAREIQFSGTNPDLSARINRKDTARRQAIEMGIPVTPGEFVEVTRPDRSTDWSVLRDVMRARLWNARNGILVKGAVGVLGSATFIVDQESEIVSVLRAIVERGLNEPYQVEEFLPLNCAPNVTVWIDPVDGSVSLVSVTDQLLNENLAFMGNRYPSMSTRQDAILTTAGQYARHLYVNEGLSGWVGLDFGEYRDPETDSPAFFFSEINARFNGGLYARAAFDTLQTHQRKRGGPVPAAYVTERRTGSPIRLGQLLDVLAELLFDSQSGSGVFLFNPATLKYGRIAALCAGRSHGEANDVAQRFRAVETW